MFYYYSADKIGHRFYQIGHRKMSYEKAKKTSQNQPPILPNRTPILALIETPILSHYTRISTLTLNS